VAIFREKHLIDNTRLPSQTVRTSFPLSHKSFEFLGQPDGRFCHCTRRPTDSEKTSENPRRQICVRKRVPFSDIHGTCPEQSRRQPSSKAKASRIVSAKSTRP
jgi:hypothetical protein